MKMETMSISVTSLQSEYVRSTVEREFGNASEFFRELLRERMKREIEADLEFLDSTDEGAPAGPSGDEVRSILETQREVRTELKRARRI